MCDIDIAKVLLCEHIITDLVSVDEGIIDVKLKYEIEQQLLDVGATIAIIGVILEAQRERVHRLSVHCDECVGVVVVCRSKMRGA